MAAFFYYYMYILVISEIFPWIHIIVDHINASAGHTNIKKFVVQAEIFLHNLFSLYLKILIYVLMLKDINMFVFIQVKVSFV